MAAKKCDKIMKSITINENREIIFSNNIKKHMKACSQCREFYDRIQERAGDTVPSCAPAVMKRIRDMETIDKSPTFAFLRKPRFWIPIAAVATIGIVLVLIISMHLLPVRNHTLRYMSIISVADTDALDGIAESNEQMNAMLNELTGKRIQLLQANPQGT